MAEKRNYPEKHVRAEDLEGEPARERIDETGGPGDMDDGRETRKSLNKGIDPHVPEGERRVEVGGNIRPEEIGDIEDRKFHDMMHDNADIEEVPLEMQEATNKPGRGRIDLMRQAGFTPGEHSGPRSTENKNAQKDVDDYENG